MVQLSNGQYIIGFDNGYQFGKTAEALFDNGVLEMGKVEPSVREHSLKYGRKYYKVGEGRAAITEDKVSDENGRLLTMAAIEDEAVRKDFDVINDSFPTIYRIDRIKKLKVLDEHFHIPYTDRFEEGEFRKRIQFMLGGKLQKVRFVYSGIEQCYGKDRGRRMYQFILSFLEKVDPLDAYWAGTVIAFEMFRDCQMLYAVHTGTENIHIHFVLSSVKADGRKVDYSGRKFKEMKERIERTAYEFFHPADGYNRIYSYGHFQSVSMDELLAGI